MRYSFYNILLKAVRCRRELALLIPLLLVSTYKICNDIKTAHMLYKSDDANTWRKNVKICGVELFMAFMVSDIHTKLFKCVKYNVLFYRTFIIKVEY